MATSKIFQKVPIEVPNRSGFNMSHKNGFSAPVGTLVPFFWDFLLPKDEIDLGAAFQIQLPPLATDFIGELDARIEYFSVPVRTLFGGWKDFVVNPLDDSNNPSDIDGQLAKFLIGAKVQSGIISTLSPTYPDVPGDNPTTSTRVVVSGDLDSLREQADKCISASMYAFNNDIYNTGVFPFTSDFVSNEKLGAGSLLDNLGFKITPEAPSALKDSWTDSLADIYSAIQQLESTLRTNIDSLTSFPNGDLNFGVMGSTVGDFYVKFTMDYYATSRKLKTEITVTFNNNNAADLTINNILPLLAYHKVFEDWYRDSKLQKSLFKRQVANTTAQSTVANMPWITSGAENKIYFTGNQLVFANGHNLFDMHQRNFQKDYFTSSTPEPQAGAPAKVSFDIENSSGEFTIASLRAANSLQQFLDRQNIAGFRYGDQIFSQYGVYPPDEITQRAIYLGSQTVPVYNKSVYQQSGDGGANTNNPFNIIGAKYANAMGVSQTEFVVNNYEVKDYCIVIGIYSLVPKVRYSSGTRRFFHYNDVSDIAFPMLAGVGDQEILKRELLDIYSGEGNTDVFGYTQRYAEYKFIDDQVHGLLRDGNNLQSFALQRSFADNVELGSSFIEIPKDYLDQVSAADYRISKFGCWVDTNISYYKASTLPAYSIPTLEDLKNTHTVIIDKNGKRL